MAVDLQTNTILEHPNRGPLEKLLRRMVMRVRNEPLLPLAFEQLTFPVAGRITHINAPRGTVEALFNVEIGPVRYCDSDTPDYTYGELWTTGQGFTRRMRDFRNVQILAPTAGSIVNISYYGEER